MISRVDGTEYTPSSYANIYAEADGYVEEVLQSEYPEMMIANIQARLINKYPSIVSCGKDVRVTTLTKERQLGCLIEMIFLVVLWDKMKDKSNLVLQAFQHCRAYIENLDYPTPYISNPMWKLVADRIPPYRKESLDDVKKEVVQLKAELEEKNRQMSEKDNEIELLKAGWAKEDNEFKVYDTPKRISVLKYLLDIPNNLVGEERTEFKKLCMKMTKAEDKTLERLLSANSLYQMANKTNDFLEKYPILRRKQGK